MEKFVIIGDSTCDLGYKTRCKYSIEYVKMNFVVDGKEYKASLDWEEFSPGEFYDLMRGGAVIKTTQVPRDEFEKTFRYWLSQGYDILYIACSSALSGSVNLARLVADELKAEFPDSRIFCIDSLISSLGQGYLLIRAAEMRACGEKLSDIVNWIESNKLRENQFATVESLAYLRRAGRVKASSAVFGDIFGVKPIIISDIKGNNYACKKVKGAANARRELAVSALNAASVSEESVLYISHADDYENAVKLRDEIYSISEFKNCYIDYIGPIVGASVGPGTIGAYVFGNQVTIEGKE